MQVGCTSGYYDFNSIKVRLKRNVVLVDVLGKEFQFHKGTIKTYLQEVKNGVKFTFQFHKGTIKTKLTVSEFTLSKHFNSIKVRLKLPATFSTLSIVT